MSKVKVFEIECDVCHKTAQAKNYLGIPDGWIYIVLSSINDRKSAVGLHLCPKHSSSVLKLLK